MRPHGCFCADGNADNTVSSAQFRLSRPGNEKRKFQQLPSAQTLPFGTAKGMPSAQLLPFVFLVSTCKMELNSQLN
jgi:hypothetical protein